MKAIQRAGILVDKRLLEEKDYFTLTVTPKTQPGEERNNLELWKDHGDTVELPRRWGCKFLQSWDLELEDQTSRGKPLNITCPEGRDDLVEGQTAFFKECVKVVRAESSSLIVAPTGNGKTVAGIHIAAKNKRSVLVVCPTVEVMLNWRDEFVRHGGMDEDDIGLLGGTHNTVEGKRVVCAVVHSVNRGTDVPEEFYTEQFGMVIWDEVHRMGAEWFRESLWKLNAEKHIGLTATPYRKDWCDNVFLFHFGNGSAVMCAATSEPVRVVVKRFDTATPFSKRFMEDRQMLVHRCIPADTARNKLVVSLVCQGYFTKQRDGLVLSESIDHLAKLLRLCEGEGIPYMEMGLYTRSCPVKLYHGKTSIEVGRVNQKAADLQRVKEDCRVIFATYGMAKEAFNVPRLSYLVEATPRADAIQHVGRIRRPLKGKPKPVAFSILDTQIRLLENFWNARRRELEQDPNVTIKLR